MVRRNAAAWLAFWDFTPHIDFGFSNVIVRPSLHKEVITHVKFQDVGSNLQSCFGLWRDENTYFWE